MHIITSITRMWLIRSIKPFTFTNEYDQVLPYSDCDSLGLYIHIPFCRNICNFCPYCKVKYDAAIADRYIDSLIKEIDIVGSQYNKRKIVTSLYFGGGSPALAVNRIDEILRTIKKYFIITEGIGIELHPDDVSFPLLSALKNAGINKISIGIQSFNPKYQHLLGRKAVDAKTLSRGLSSVEFETVSMDFIFALPGQTFDDLKKDIDEAFSNGANHIAIYPFIDFSFTSSKLKAMPKRQKRDLLDNITNYCLDKGLIRDSIWTFSRNSSHHYSSMTRTNFLGFGCSATTLLKEQFKINTFSIEEYCKRLSENKLPSSLTIRFTLRQRMVYYLFWTAYSMQVSEKGFQDFFNIPLKKMYGIEFAIARLFKILSKENGEYTLTLKGAFLYHYYENFYTLSYIDKMWNIMRREAFPDYIKL